MNDFTFRLDAGAINADSRARGKDMLFAEIATLADRVYGLPADRVEQGLAQRESLGTTGFGLGVGIPHTRIEGLAEPVALVVRPLKPIDYASVDDLPVDIVFGLLSPADGGAVHLKALAELSRMLRDPKLIANLRGANDAASIYAVIEGYGARHAA
jgi:PTS system nitrogen regulatory IIA component